MKKLEKIDEYLSACPYVAILRGITPNEVLKIAYVLIEYGIKVIEVPLNSPRALKSIQFLADNAEADILIGAGTVLTFDQVSSVKDAGGKLIVSPNMNRTVIEKTKQSGMISIPGVFTPTEAFEAISRGADALKYFPANIGGPSAIKAWLAVLPSHIPIVATGGIDHKNMEEWKASGCIGLGLGSSLYKPGDSAQEVGRKLAKF